MTTKAEVAKHTTETDCWVIIDGEAYDCTKFLPDHPGGKKAILIYGGKYEKAILIYGGKDATEEFDMLHERKVIEKYGIAKGVVKKIGKVSG